MALHTCKFMPPDGVYIEQEEYEDGKHCWWLVIYREATEEDLENNHYLDMVGDTIWSTTVEVAFCPYCGEWLLPEKSGVDSVNPSHEDFSGWHAVRS
ncbi:hypothetical protein M3P05_14235 [Sansalvadorimonas sp. 2012CJ34-2]|uniref:Uncharacterized protein n=1 Tax=Parendozoicomonas callyspongiae TaxID=2942213 RepID=A0ABT0PI61_9GAMM|nr:hypothetical protein [Sansalvadorimonas sp. 2012CJ34-2]MCL6271084.1 hypothetical protein [Sansalvadorimonas sp. 2012CJ34-2]